MAGLIRNDSDDGFVCLEMYGRLVAVLFASPRDLAGLNLTKKEEVVRLKLMKAMSRAITTLTQINLPGPDLAHPRDPG
ncbi:MAG: hypothetical protein ABI967_12905 [bacterium]